MKTQGTIDYNKLIREIEDLLKGSPAITKSYKNGKKFTIEILEPEGKYEIDISSGWIGFDFQVKRSDGKFVSAYYSDTDNYTLEFDSVYTMKVFEDLKRFTADVLDRKILIGTKGDANVIAIPTSRGGYEVTLHHPRRRWWHIGSKVEIVNLTALDETYVVKPIKLGR